MGSGSTKGAKTTSTNEVVADVILPGATEAFTVRGKVGRPKPTPEHTDDAERDSVTNTRLFTGSDNRPVPDETETSKTIGNKQYHQPTGKISGSHREEVRPKSAAAKKSSTATVTEVAKDTYTIEYENQRFDVSGSEFSTFLQDAAEMTVTDTLKVSDPFQAGGSGKTFQFKVLKPQSGEGPMRLQLQNRYMEVEDLEEDVIDEILGVPVTSNKENESPDEKISEKKEQMRQALQMKKTQLTKEQYEQMIANHKQETELMELIRKKEKNRQQIALEEKMNQRRIRKKRKEAEKREQDLLLAGQASQYQSTKGKSSQESEMDENKKKEIEDEIAKKNSEFERELQLKKHQLSEHEYQLIIAEHKQHMIEMTKDLEIAGERQKQALAAKLEERKKRRARKAEKVKLQQDVVTDASVYVSDDSDVEMGEENKLKKIQKEIDKKNGKFARDVELRRRNGEISDEEYQRLQKEHNSDIQRLVNKLQEEKARQQQAVQNKLGSKKSGAWQTKEEQEKMLDNQLADEVAATKSEVSEIEMQMARAKTQFEEEMKKKRNKISKEEYEKLLAEHEEEMERLRRKLDRGKDRQRLALLEKLANRKKKRGMKLTEEEERAKLLAALKNKEVLSEEQLRLLQKDIAQYRSEFDEDMKKRRSQLSPEEYERIMADHKKDMEDLEKKLQQEKEKMGMSLADKIAARKMKKKGKTTPEDEVLDQIGEEITDIEVEIQKKEKEFQKKIERGKMSNADYAKLLAEHDEEMERLRRKLALQKDRQRQKLLEKIAARKNKKDMRATEEEQRAKLLAALVSMGIYSFCVAVLVSMGYT
ncbi:uncharacterized protein LOC100370935 [Saccoglossus kowalevskii]|uniref:Calponin homology domain-containing protein DDB_G0272472-like n=1 Tax=Saccoglossus kowalevskii TaxID=10224 RepID=A0ABM0LTN7_SACKO|nr:PREDICTED: calponin homology domain-containing protein DDB_G0272472-like [Saccoglossus kowalevskii]